MKSNRGQSPPERLAPIVAAARARSDALLRATGITTLKQQARKYERRSLVDVLRRIRPAIIAEVKKASPSKGLFRTDFDPVRLAAAYSAGGASAISVVTEPEFFQGNGEWIKLIRKTVDLPILRKDFIVDPVQVAESAALGADAILLIVRILSDAQMRSLTDIASELNLDILYEIHDAKELESVAVMSPALVGVNARNLDDFMVDTGIFARVKPKIEAGVLAVAESGIETPEQVAEFSHAGYHAFLIGETLIRSDNPSEVIRWLTGETKRPD